MEAVPIPGRVTLTPASERSEHRCLNEVGGGGLRIMSGANTDEFWSDESLWSGMELELYAEAERRMTISERK